MKRIHKLGLALLIAAAAVVACPLTVRCVGKGIVAHERGARQNLLKQLGQAFKAYANNDAEERWVTRDRDAWLPDLELLEPYLNQQPDKQAVLNYLHGGRGVQLCYLGHAVRDDIYGLKLLQLYSDGDAAGIVGRTLPADDVDDLAKQMLEWSGTQSPIYYVAPEIHPFREGIERYWIQEINGAAGSAWEQSKIPVCWEMPEDNLPVGGNVLFVDGHVEFVRYPSKFPMTGPFISPLRALLAPLPEKDTAHGAFIRWACGGPKMRAAIQTPYYFAPEILNGEVHLEEWTPNIEVDGQKGYRVFAGVPLVLFPDSAGLPDGLKKQLWKDERRLMGAWPGRAGSQEPFVADMGTGYGLRWFVFTTAATQDGFREHLGLSGGDDRFQLLTEHQAFSVMPRLGEDAVPYLASVVNSKALGQVVREALKALEDIPGTAADEARQQAFAADNPKAFRNAKIVALEFNGDGWKASRLAEECMLRSDDVDESADIALAAELEKDERGGAPGIDSLAVLKKLPRESVMKALERLSSKEPGLRARLDEIQQSLDAE